MSLRSQRRLASDILKTGTNSVWIDPERIEDVDGAITRADVRRLIHEGVIKTVDKQGTSRGRARLLHEKKKRGLRQGPGSKTGHRTAKIPRKKIWETHIRAVRRHLKELRDHRAIQVESYRKLYLLAKGGIFSSVASIDQYVDAHKLARRR